MWVNLYVKYKSTLFSYRQLSSYKAICCSRWKFFTAQLFNKDPFHIQFISFFFEFQNSECSPLVTSRDIYLYMNVRERWEQEKEERTIWPVLFLQTSYYEKKWCKENNIFPFEARCSEYKMCILEMELGLHLTRSTVSLIFQFSFFIYDNAFV